MGAIWLLRFVDRCFRDVYVKAACQLNERADLLYGDGGCRTHKAVVSNLHKACRQNMLQEPANELHYMKFHCAPSLALRFIVAYPDIETVKFDDATVGDGDFEDVRGQVVDNCSAVSHSLAVDIEVVGPDHRIDCIEQAEAFEFMTKLCSEDSGHGLYRGKEILP